MSYNIYCIWNPMARGGGGYYGQDIKGSEENFPRIGRHIDSIFSNSQDSAATIISQYGIGGMYYGYWNFEDDYCGLTPEIWNSFLNEYNLKDEHQKDGEMCMHLAEMCFITSNRGDLSEVNKAIGGGGLTLDFTKWEPIKIITNKYNDLIKIDNTFTAGKVIINDLNDLMPEDRNGEIVALNKIFYAKKYCLLRILTRIAPYLALYGKGDDKDTINDWIRANLINLLRNDKKSEAIKNITNNFYSKLHTTCNELTNEVNTLLKNNGESFTIDLWAVLKQDGNKEIETMLDFLTKRIANIITAHVRQILNATIGGKVKIISSNLTDWNDSSSDKISKNFKKVFRISKETVLKGTTIGKNGTEKYIPKWYLMAKEHCHGRHPDKLVDENIIKRYANNEFIKIFNSTKDTGLIPAGTGEVIQVGPQDWLMNRMREVYSQYFSSQSTTLIYWDMSYRMLMSSKTKISIDQELEDGVIVRTESDRLYEWKNLWNIYNRWATSGLSDMPLGWF